MILQLWLQSLFTGKPMPINVLHITHSMGPSGGIATGIRTLGKAINREQVRLFLAITYPAQGPEILPENTELLPYRCDPDKAWFRQHSFLRALRGTIRENHVDIVHTHTNFSMGLGIAAGLFTPARMVRSIHQADVPENGRRPISSYFWPCFISQYILVNPVMRDSTRLSYGTPSRKTCVITNGLAPETVAVPPGTRQRKRRELGIATNDILLLNAGRLRPVKNQAALITAMKQVVAAAPNARLLIAGDGEVRPELEARIADLELRDHVVLLGHRTDMSELLAAVDIYVQPSILEAMSMSIIEAMNARKAIVSSDIPTIAYLLPPGCALLIPPTDTDALAAAILHLINDPGLRAAMGRAAAERAVKFSATCMAAEHEALYRKLTHARHAKATPVTPSESSPP